MNQPDTLQRIAVIGTSCSGKTTLARTLAGQFSAAHIQLDALHWLPGWQPRPPAEFQSLTTAAIAAERWVLDGNYSQVRPIIWRRATALIWLNYAFPVVFWRALKRTVRRAATREELFAGNRETFRQSFFSRDSILLWVLQTYHHRRREYPQLFKEPQFSHLHIIEFQSPRQTALFVTQVAKQG